MSETTKGPTGVAAPLPPSILQLLNGGGAITCGSRGACETSTAGSSSQAGAAAGPSGGEGGADDAERPSSIRAASIAPSAAPSTAHAPGDDASLEPNKARDMLLLGGSPSQGFESLVAASGGGRDSPYDFSALSAAGHLSANNGGMPPLSPPLSEVLGENAPRSARRRPARARAALGRLER